MLLKLKKVVRACCVFWSILFVFLVYPKSALAARLDTEERANQPALQSSQAQQANPPGAAVGSGTSASSTQPTSQVGTTPPSEGGVTTPLRRSFRGSRAAQSGQVSQPATPVQPGQTPGGTAPAPAPASQPQQPAVTRPPAGATPAAPPAPPVPAPVTPPPAAPIQRPAEVARPGSEKGMGKDVMVTPSRGEPKTLGQRIEEANSDKEKISLDFEDVDVRVIIKFISETTGQNFLIDDKVKGKVTIISPKKIPLKDVRDVFLSILEIQGFSTVKAGDVIKILPAKDVTQRGIDTKVGKELSKIPKDDKIVTQLIPMSFADANEMKTLLTPLISKNSTIISYPPTNTLIITDIQSNLNRLVTIMKELDIPAEAEEITVLPVMYSTAEEMAKVVNQVLEEKKGAKGAVTAAATRRRAGVAPAGQAIESVEEVLKIIPEPRTNSLILVATAEKTRRIRDLVARLDVERPRKEGNFHIIFLENADAEEMMKTLSNIAEKSTQTTGKPGAPGAPTPPTPIGTTGTTTATTTARPSGPAGMEVGAVEFKGKVKIASDKPTNALIINAEPEDYHILKDLIDKLDIRRLQVYLEAAIVELSTSASHNLGLDFTAGTALGENGAAFFSTFGQLSKLIGGTATGALSILPSGGATTIGALGGSVQVPVPGGTKVSIPGAIVIAQALESKAQGNILATPHLLTMDNEEAEIVIAQNIPFTTSTTTLASSVGNVVQNIDRRDVGITLRFTPTINESNTIKLKMFQEISNAIPTTTDGIDPRTAGPTTQKRTAKSTLLVQDGQTIAIGGLTQDNVTASRSRTPCLGDLPGLGLLFKNATHKNDKTNLLIFITPRIVRGPQDLADVTSKKDEYMREFKEKQGVREDKAPPKGLKESIQRNYEFLNEW